MVLMVIKMFFQKFINKFYLIDIQDKEKIYKICKIITLKILSFNLRLSNSVLWINDKLENKKSLNKFILNKIKLNI